MFYDPNKHCIVDPLIDYNLEFVLDDNTFEELMGPDNVEPDLNAPVTTPGRPAPRALQSTIVPQGDADSISTFGESMYSRRIDSANKSRFRNP